jgi:SAM-dependent methyltransferase
MGEEKFQPISVKPPSSNQLLFRLRCWVDLQLGTIATHLKPRMARLHGRILDVGAGESPWREWLPANCSYQGIDIENAQDYGMSARKPDVTYFDGVKVPFADATFDGAICIEVLEHVADPEGLISEIARVLKDGAPILMTVPWSARRHHIPHDYHRFTRERLEQLFQSYDFGNLEILERGNDVGAIANKMIVLTIRLLMPTSWKDASWSIPLALPMGVLSGMMLCAAHASEYLGRGSLEDPLGYFIQGIRVVRKSP